MKGLETWQAWMSFSIIGGLLWSLNYPEHSLLWIAPAFHLCGRLSGSVFETVVLRQGQPERSRNARRR